MHAPLDGAVHANSVHATLYGAVHASSAPRCPSHRKLLPLGMVFGQCWEHNVENRALHDRREKGTPHVQPVTSHVANAQTSSTAKK